MKTEAIGGRAFSYQAPVLWNQFPDHGKKADTFTEFKSKLKTFLLKTFYGQVG